MVKYKRMSKEGPILLIGLTEGEFWQYKHDKCTVIPLDSGAFNMELRGDIYTMYAPNTRDYYEANMIIEDLDEKPINVLVKKQGNQRFQIIVGLSESTIFDLRHGGMANFRIADLPVDSSVDFQMVFVYGRDNEAVMEQLRPLLTSDTVIKDTTEYKTTPIFIH